MFKMSQMFVGSAVCALALMIAVAASQAADGTTTWKGSYAYVDGRPAVRFTLTLTTKGKTISGRVVEPATFGDGSSDNLIANITGTSFGYSVSFVKTYDGTGGQSHSVNYRGTIDGETMYGFWQIGEQDVGAWYATQSGK